MKTQVMRRGRVRRAKLYYLRNLTGKAARIRDIRQFGGYYQDFVDEAAVEEKDGSFIVLWCLQ